MSAFSTVPTVHRNRARLSVQALEARDVPATTVLDLSIAGSAGTANGAILQQASPIASTDFHTFLKINATGTEEGYNTDARPFQLDQVGTRAVTHSLKLTDVPIVTIGGVDYRQFMLDVKEGVRRTQISLDELRIYLGEAGNFTNYNSRTKTLAGQTAVYDMDAAGNVSVKLNAALNPTAKGDAYVLIPSAIFGNSTYVYLYSKFGGRIEANGGAEEWGVLPVSTGGGGTASISGAVYFDVNGNHVFEPDAGVPDQTISNVTVVLERFNGSTWTEVGRQSTGTFSFTGLSAGTYRLTKLNDFDPALLYDGLNQVGSAGGVDTNQFTEIDPGWSSVDVIDQIIIGNSTVATGYNFEVVPVPEPN